MGTALLAEIAWLLLTEIDGVEAGPAVVGLVDGGHGDDDADEQRQHSCAHEHQTASPAELTGEIVIFCRLFHFLVVRRDFIRCERENRVVHLVEDKLLMT